MLKILCLLIAAAGLSFGQYPIVATRIVRGFGTPPSSTCVTAAQVSAVYVRLDSGATASPLYICTNTGTGTYAWVNSFTGGAGSGTVTSVGMVGTANQITVTGTSPITSSGSFTLSIPTNPTLPGTTTGTFSGNLTGNVTGNASGTAATITGAIVEANTPLTTKGDLLVDDGTTLHRLAVGADGLVLTADAASTDGVKWNAVSGTGDVVGPGSATDNAIARFDGTSGKAIQNSVVTIADTTGDMSSPGNAAFGVGGSVGGALGLGQGTATTAASGIVGFMAPGTVTTPFYVTMPAAPTTGFFLNTGTTDPSVLSFVAFTGTSNVVRATSPTFTGAITLGTDNSAAGTVLIANGSANAHTVWGSGATTTNTINGFAAVPTTGRLIDCTVTSTTCLLHDSGITTANVVNASSPGAGICRFAGSTQTCTSAELSGDATTSGSNAVTVAKVAGTAAATIKTRALSFSIGDPTNSSALTTSSVSQTLTVPFACTISAYNLAFGPGDTGTITVKFWKKATGTAIPTISDVINTSGVAIASGTAIHSATVSDFTTTTVTKDDMIAMVVTAVATTKSITGVLQCDQ